ncbi:MAG: sigma-70 family RNA polymerase sigma factor [Flavobacteriales bacterium]
MVHTPSQVQATATDIASQPDWVSGLRRNDPATVRALYAKHFAAVRQYVLQNSGTGNDAQDMFQEALIVLWMNVKEGRFKSGAESDPGGFLFRVAKNKWLDVLRSAAHKQMKVVHDERTTDAQAEVADDIDDRIVRLRGVYDKLDDKCRVVLDQFYFERKDLATIAADMGVEEESIRTIKYRCMMKLRAFRHTIAGEDNTGEV